MTFFDTAEAYGPLANEELVGEALAPFREEEENLAAVDLALATGELSAVEEASSRIMVRGARYPEFQEKLTGR